MIVLTNLYPICRGKATKSKKVQMTFVSSYYGEKGDDGLFVETSTVSIWLPADVAVKVKAGQCYQGVIDVNGEMVISKEITVEGTRYKLGKEAEKENQAQADLPY